MIPHKLRLALAAIAMLVIAFPSSSFACSMTSNAEVTIALGDPAPHTVDPDEILEGTPSCPGPYDVIVFNTDGSMRLNPIVDCDDVGKRLLVKVTATTGNSVWSYATIVDNLKPVVTAANITITCVDDIETLGRAAISASDNCTATGDLTFRITSIPSSVGCANGIAQTFIRSIFVIDEAGNRSATVPQTITVARVSIADVVFPANVTYMTSDTTICPAAFGVPEIEYPTVNGLPISSICKILTTVEDEELTSCGSSRKILRNFRLLDCCTNETRESFQVITIMDDQAPKVLSGIGQALQDTITAINLQGNLNCTGTVFFRPIVAVDSCSSDPLSYVIRTPFGAVNGNGGQLSASFPLDGTSFEAIYEVRDACGNLAADTIVVLRDDNLPPVAICDELTTVSLATATTTIPAINFDDGSYDNCGIDSFTVRRMGDIDWETSVSFNCDDVHDTVLVEFRVTDFDGNSNICMVQVIVEDKIPASVNPLPAVTFSCIRNPVDTFFSGVPTVNEVCVGGYSLDTIINDDSMLQCRTGVQTRKFIFTNAAGQMIMTTQMIMYVDSGSITIPTVLADTTVDCSLDVLTLPTRTFSTDCDVFAVNTSAATTRIIDCSTIEFNIVYNYMPLCGNGPGFSLNRKITQVDNEAPVWEPFPGDLDSTYACELPSTVLAPTSTDACNISTVELVDFTSVPGGNSACPEVTNTYTWMTRDACGNENPTPIVRVIRLIDEEAPIFGTIGDFAVDCKAEIRDTLPAFILVENGVTDNCPRDIEVRILSNVADTADACLGSIVRTYIATDACGNSSTASQTISYDQTGASLILNTLPDITNLQCYSDVTAFPSPSVQVLGGSICGAGLVITSSFTDPDPGTCPATVIRLFTVEDNCGNTGSVTQLYTFNDTTPPEFSGALAINVQCESDIPTIATTVAALTVTDNCQLISTTAVDAPATGNTSCAGTVIRTYTATDACMNTATVSQTITWDGVGSLTLTPLTADGIVYSCYAEIIAATQITDPSFFGTGICGTPLKIDSVNHTQDPGCFGNVMRGYYLQDDCGNRDSVFQNFVVNDFVEPIFSGVMDTTIICRSDLPSGQSTSANISVADNCTGRTASFSVTSTIEDPNNTACSGFWIRTYTAIDACSNTATATQMITYGGGTLMLNNLPEFPDTFTCYQDVLDFDPGYTASQFGSASCGRSLNLVGTPTNSSNPGCAGPVTRTFTLQDDCGNMGTATQVLIVKDTVGPELMPPTDRSFFNSCLRTFDNVRAVLVNPSNNVCNNDPATFIFANNSSYLSGTGNANSLDASGAYPSGITEIVYTATDLCGNVDSVMSIINVIDPVRPTVDCENVFLVLDENGLVTLDEPELRTYITVEDNCEVASVTLIEPSLPITFDCSNNLPLVLDYIYEAEDRSGNTRQASCQIIVQDPPKLECMNLEFSKRPDIDLEVTLASVVSQFMFSDNCTPTADLTFSSSTLPFTYSCADLGTTSPTIFTHSVTIQDGDFEETTCDFEISVFHDCPTPLQDPFAIAGRVDAPLYGGTMDATEVRVDFSGGFRTTISDQDGYYSFSQIPPGAISLSAKLPMVSSDRVTTFDMLKIGQHVLGTSELKDPLVILAADVNKSGNISAFDLTAIRRVILGLDASFGGEHEAATVGALHTFSDTDAPWADANNWGTEFTYVSEDMMSLDISAVKLGDINPEAFLLPRGASELFLDDHYVNAGEAVEILVRNDYQSAIAGLQLAVKANGDLEVNTADANVEALSNEVNGATRISILQEMLPGEPLMTWTFTPRASGMLSDLIQISNDIPNESYAVEDFQPAQLALRWNNSNAEGALAEINAFPNPFDNHLSVSAHLTAQGKHLLKVSDMTGRSFAERRIEVGQDSWHNLRLDTETWPSGVYILTLEGPSGRLTQRVVLQR